MEDTFWKVGNKAYHFQTSNRDIRNKLKRWKDAGLVAEGINCNLWVFRLEYNTLKNARIALNQLTDGRCTLIPS